MQRIKEMQARNRNRGELIEDNSTQHKRRKSPDEDDSVKQGPPRLLLQPITNSLTNAVGSVIESSKDVKGYLPAVLSSVSRTQLRVPALKTIPL